MSEALPWKHLGLIKDARPHSPSTTVHHPRTCIPRTREPLFSHHHDFNPHSPRIRLLLVVRCLTHGRVRILGLRTTSRGARPVAWPAYGRYCEHVLLGDVKVTYVSVSQDAHIAALSGNLQNHGATIETVDTANAAEIPFPPTSYIYLEDLTNDFDDVYQVSTRRLIIHRGHLLTCCAPGFLQSLVCSNAV